MNKFLCCAAAAVMFCTFDIGTTAAFGTESSKGCICSFLTIPSSSDGGEGEAPEQEIEYSFKLYEIIKKFFG